MSHDLFDLSIHYSRAKTIVLLEAQSLQDLLDPGSIRPQVMEFVKGKPISQRGNDLKESVVTRKTVLRQEDAELNPLAAVVNRT